MKTVLKTAALVAAIVLTHLVIGWLITITSGLIATIIGIFLFGVLPLCLFTVVAIYGFKAVKGGNN